MEWCKIYFKIVRMSMMINIDYNSRTPIYEQIVASIENLVATGVLEPNTQIASIRELAISLIINPNTVKKAYDILESKNIIVSKSTKGTFISENVNEARKAKIAQLFLTLDKTITELETLGVSKTEISKKINNQSSD